MTPAAKRSCLRRIDLGILPPETEGRFRMLALAAVLVGLNAGFLVAHRTGDMPTSEERRAFGNRVAAVFGDRGLRELSVKEIEARSHELSPMIRERLRDQARRLLLPGLFMAALLGTARAIYRGHPKRLLRRYDAQPLKDHEAPTVVGYLRSCERSLGLKPLDLRYGGTGYANDAQTFGLRGREVLLLRSKEPGLLERTWGATAKAIALHELGHIVNGDAQHREKSKALWLSLLGLLSLAGCVLAFRGEAFLQAEWRLAAMPLFVWMTWSGLVRAREYYADRWVAAWGLESTLDRMLRLPDKDRPWERLSWWKAGWKRWGHRGEWERFTQIFCWLAKRTQPIWKPHPSNQLRRETLADPGRLFRVSSDLPFVTGVLLSILVVNLFLPMVEVFSDLTLAASLTFWSSVPEAADALPPGWQKPLLLIATAVINLGGPLLLFSLVLGSVSYLIAQVLAVQVQRQALADLAAGHTRMWGYGKLWRPAFLLALGMAVGLAITPFDTGLTFARQVVLTALWLFGLTCLTWLWLAYVRALARFTLGMETGPQFPGRLRRLAVRLPAALLTVLYWPAAFALMAYPLSLLTTSARPSTADPQEHFAYMIVMTGCMLAILVIAVYVVWAAISLAVVAVRLRRRRSDCLSCGDALPRGFVVGRSCSSCGEPLAPWSCERPPFDPSVEVTA